MSLIPYEGRNEFTWRCRVLFPSWLYAFSIASSQHLQTTRIFRHLVGSRWFNFHGNHGRVHNCLFLYLRGAHNRRSLSTTRCSRTARSSGTILSRTTIKIPSAERSGDLKSWCRGARILVFEEAVRGQGLFVIGVFILYK
jgi:hypothetical protein